MTFRDGSAAGTGGAPGICTLNSDHPVPPKALANKDGRSVYVIRLEPLPGIDATRGLRWLLKTALRVYGLRCTSAEQVRR